MSNAAQETTKPVVVNFGGIKGLGIGGAVLLGNNKENNPLRQVYTDVKYLNHLCHLCHTWLMT